MTEDVRKALEVADEVVQEQITDGVTCQCPDCLEAVAFKVLAVEVRRREGQNWETAFLQQRVDQLQRELEQEQQATRDILDRFRGLLTWGRDIQRAIVGHSCNAWQPREAQTGQGE
jgi:hypothetical protein